MFCLTCGTEVGQQQRTCPGCGAPVRDTTAPAARHDEAPAPPPPRVPLATPGPLVSALTAAPAAALAAIPLAEPPSLPSQRAAAWPRSRRQWGLLIAAIAALLLADALLPWVRVESHTVALTGLGAQALLPLVVALGLILGPVVLPLPRARALWSATPIAVSGMLVGMGAGVWLLLRWLAPHIIPASAVEGLLPGAPAVFATPLLPVYQPAIGLYLFMAGALALLAISIGRLAAADGAVPMPAEPAPPATLASGAATAPPPTQPPLAPTAAPDAPAAHATNGHTPAGATSIILPGSSDWQRATPAPSRLNGGTPRPPLAGPNDLL